MEVAEGIILGVLQGLTEWLPISSSGQGMLVLMQFMDFEPESAFSFALLLHLGSLFAILIYFRKEISQMVRASRSSGRDRDHGRKITLFLAIATAATGITGVPLYLMVSKSFSMLSGDIVIGMVGVLLVGTGLMLRKRQGGNRKIEDLSRKDSLLVGLVQGLAVLPGISRSGVTIGALLVMGVDGETSLKLSFLLAAPAIAGAMLLGGGFSFGPPALAGILTSFVVSLFVMGYLIQYSRRTNFSSFCVFIGAIAVVASLAPYVLG